MRILVITNLFTPDRGGGASVFSDLCVGLREKGWDVTVFTTHPYYPEWKRKAGGRPWSIDREVFQNVEVWRHGIYVPDSPSRLIPRVLYELSFALSLSRSLWRGGKFDLVMVFCPLLGTVIFAGLRRALKGEPLWLNVQDIPADAAAASGISQSGMFNSAATWLQRFVFNRADVWSTISPVMVQRLSGLRERNQPIHLCPNWLNGSLAECVAALPSKLGRTPKVKLKLLYAGNIGKKQGLLEFCEMLGNSNAEFQFRINGNGGEAEGVREWINRSHDPRFEFGEFLDEQGFTRALHESDVYVITEKPGSGASFIPSKLIPGIASGTPVLAVCDQAGPLGREMQEAGLGQVLEWDQIVDLPQVLSSFISQPDQFRCWQSNCINHSRNYNRDFSIQRLEYLLRKAIDGVGQP